MYFRIQMVSRQGRRVPRERRRTGKSAEANKQHKSIFGALRAAAPKWVFEQIKFVVGNSGSVNIRDFYTKLIKFDVEEEKKHKLFADHVTQVCKAHDRVILSFLQQVQEFARSTTEE